MYLPGNNMLSIFSIFERKRNTTGDVYSHGLKKKPFFFRNYCVVFSIVFFAISAFAAEEQGGSLFVDAEELLKQLKARDSIIVDVRDSADYADGHVVGAVNLPVKQTFNPSGRTDRVGSLSYIQDLFGQAGIDLDTRVYIYDSGRLIDAGRMFWVLEAFGHSRVKVLDGGFEVWQGKGLPVSLEPHQAKAKQFIASIQPAKLATKLSVRLISQSQHKTLIDSRSEEEFLGRKSISARSGHIPSAINIPWHRNLRLINGVPVMKPVSELREIYKSLDKDKAVVTYCNKGKESSFTYLVLRELGFDVAHYDGSWFEWSNDNSLPVAK